MKRTDCSLLENQPLNLLLKQIAAVPSRVANPENGEKKHFVGRKRPWTTLGAQGAGSIVDRNPT